MPSPAETEQATNLERRTREYPLAALHLDCGPMQFGDAQRTAEGIVRVPVQQLIRSNEGVERFGEVWYHDFAGMQRKDRVAIDHQHNADEPLGYLDRFEVKPDGLWASGYLVLVEGDELGRKIVDRAQAGVPYEASIYFGGNGMRIEEVGPNATADVNGRPVQGPAVIFRQWPLRGVAVCLYGADGQTKTKLDDSGETISVSIERTGDNSMSEKQSDHENQGQPDEPLTKRGFFNALGAALGFGKSSQEQEADGQPADTAAGDDAGKQEADTKERAHAAPEAKQDDDAAQGGEHPGKRFLDAFGDAGARWFVEGLTFDQAQAKHTAALKAENDELKQKLSAVDRGEDDPAEFSGEDGEDEGGKLTSRLRRSMSPGLARFAASIKLPSGRNGRR